MSDVREQLIEVLRQSASGRSTFPDHADAILERFEVTPKPVMTAEELGEMLINAFMWGDATETRGKMMFDQLDSAGLTIVRREEVDK